ncbi:MAG: AMP-binding protein [Candidatus Rokubacteria bacterium]|nr:AMP-binding protein [Candidatus Rokubacteria bacterium]
MDIFAAHAERQPDRPAIVEDERAVTWRAFVDARNRFAHALAGLGLEPGDRVVLHAGNSLDYLLAGAAARAVGAVPVPMNHRLTAPEVAYILADADATAVFVGDQFLSVAEAVRPGAGKVREWILIGAERRPWARHLDDLVAAGSPAPYPVNAAGLGASMVYTAGTTGKPKGALRRAADPAAALPTLHALGVVDPDHVHLVAGPLYHSAPGAFAVWAQMLGNTVVVMPKFDPEQALRLIERHRCTTTFMAPTLLKRIVDLPAAVRGRYDVSSMRALVIAAAPCPMRVKEAALEMFGPAVYEFYGSTELGINTVLRPEDILRKPGSCGAAAPGMELAILDDAGTRLPPRQPGELFVRRHPGVFDEYHKQPEATRQTARGDWLSVGDVAWMDEEGFVYICDRKRDMIISGGVNIYPAEIEDVLHRHPKIQDVAVFGVPDEDWGERVHAAVQPRAGQTLTAPEVVDFARERLAGYKVPREVSFHADFPRDAAGKLLKRLLREPYWAGRASRV